MEFGLQTFTVRGCMKTFAQTERTLHTLAETGIKNVELAVDYLRFPFTPDTARTLRGLFDASGIAVRSCQIKYATASADPKKTTDYLHCLGAQYVTNSVIDLKLLLKGTSAVREYCAMLNALHKELAEQNITLCHHNHHYEFLKYGGQSVLAIMAESFHGSFVLDTYWCQKGGGNMLTLLDDLAGRVPILHLRDFRVQPFGLLAGGKDAEIGAGNLPFPAIVQKAEKAGILYGVVEQKTKTPLDSVRQSWQYLESMKKG